MSVILSSEVVMRGTLTRPRGSAEDPYFEDLEGLGPTSERRVARATSSPRTSRRLTPIEYSCFSFVVGTGQSQTPVIVPRAFLRYSIERPETMKRASSGSE